MSERSPRSLAFLGEMGLGLQWTLRQPPAVAVPEAPPPPASPLAILAPEPVLPSAPLAAPVVALPAAGLEVAAMRAPAAPPVVPEPPMQPEPSAPPTQPELLTPPTLPEPPAPPTQPEPPAPLPVTMLAMPETGDTAWFDDAPAPRRPAPVTAAAIAAMDWPALTAAIAACTRCALCATRRNVVPGRGALPAEWIAIVPAPGRLDEKEARIVSGEAGQLLDNMLNAIELSTAGQVYLTPLVKCRPQGGDGAERSPSLEEVTACRPFLERELVLSGARMGMTFGQVAAKGLLGAAARGKVQYHGSLPVVATYHPDDLLRKPQDKAKAWADLCLAKAARD